MATPSLSARLVWALAGGALICSALGCAQFRAGQERIRRATIDPLAEMFDKDAKDKKKGGDASAVQKTSAQSSTTAGSTTAGSGRTPEGAFFTVPPRWSVNAHVEARHMYRLAHDTASASIVVTHEAHTAADPDARQDHQRAQHRKLFKRLPEYYKQVEYREWVDGEPAASTILTRVEGARDKDSAKTTVIGYSITRGEDLFMVIGALPLDQAEALHADMKTLIGTLKAPAPPEKPDAEKQPAEGGEEKPAEEKPAEGAGEEKPAEEKPAEGAEEKPANNA